MAMDDVKPEELVERVSRAIGSELTGRFVGIREDICTSIAKVVKELYNLTDEEMDELKAICDRAIHTR